MKFANILTGEIRDVLPSTLALANETIQNATIEHYKSLGWRRVLSVAAPTSGYRVTAYNVVEVDGTTCNLTVKTEVNIAQEASSAAAAQIAADKDAAKLLTDVATEPAGRVMRAFATLVRTQINTLRAQHGLSQFTEAQFITALKNEIASQS